MLAILSAATLESTMTRLEEGNCTLRKATFSFEQSIETSASCSAMTELQGGRKELGESIKQTGRRSIMSIRRSDFTLSLTS